MFTTKEVSDGDNSYNLPIELEDQFNKDCEFKSEEWTEAWFEECEKFDEKYGGYQI